MSLPKLRHNLSQTLGASIVALLSVATIGMLQAPQLQTLQNPGNQSMEELERQEDAEAARLELLERSPAFGFDNLMSNWVFLSFLQYFGDDEVRDRIGYTLSPEYFDIVTRRDPYFIDSYIFLSTSSTIYAGQPEHSIALMNEGLASLMPTTPPDSYFVWRQKGIDELLFLGDSALARDSFLTAAEWANASPLDGSESAATLSRQTAQFLANNPDSTYAQIAAWVMVINNAVDSRVVDRAIEQIEALGGSVDPETLSVQMPGSDS